MHSILWREFLSVNGQLLTANCNILLLRFILSRWRGSAEVDAAGDQLGGEDGLDHRSDLIRGAVGRALSVA